MAESDQVRAGEMVQCLKAFATLSEGLSFIPRTRIAAPPEPQAQGIQHLLLASMGARYKCSVQNTHNQKIKINLTKPPMLSNGNREFQFCDMNKLSVLLRLALLKCTFKMFKMVILC